MKENIKIFYEKAMLYCRFRETLGQLLGKQI